MKSSIRRHPFVAFVVIAYAVTWFFQILAIVLAERHAIELGNEHNLLFLVDLLSVQLASGEAAAYLTFLLAAGPLIGALIVIAATAGKPGLSDLWTRMRKWRIEPRWYLIAFLVPIGIAGVALLAGIVMGGLRFDSYSPILSPGYFIPFFLYAVVFTGLWEEPGWRGFALPHLQTTYTADKASWILGVIWGVWHFPFIIYFNLNNDVAPPVLIPILVGSVLGTVGWTIVNTWIYNSTESVFLMILLHGWYNAVNAFVVLPFENMTASTIGAVLPWALAVYVSKRFGDENLAARPRPKLSPQLAAER